MSPTSSPLPTAVPTSRQPVLLHHVLPDRSRATTPADAALLVAFEKARPSRAIPMHPRQKHTPGLYWSATDGRLLEYESYLEARWMTLYDFDAEVVAMAAQPFHLQALDDTGAWEHWPDLFLRLHDGSGRVVDVKDPRMLDDPDVLLQAHRTASVCADIGFEYEMVGEPEPTLWRNVEWLAGYRRHLPLPDSLYEQLLALAARPVPIGALADGFEVPELARTAVLRLCWQHRLHVDLSAPLRDTTLVCAVRPEDL